MGQWSRRRLRTALITWLALTVVLVSVAILAEYVLDRGLERIAVEFLIVTGLVVALQSFVGNSGILSFGHVAFFAVGAYVTALATIPPTQKESLVPDLPSWLAGMEAGLGSAMGLAVVAVILFAAATGAAITRMRESVMPMATLALLVMAHSVFALWDGVTRGNRGLVGIPDQVSTWTAMGGAVLIAGIALLFAASQSGLRLQAVRDDPVAAAAMGISVVRARFAGWMVSALLMGVGATLWASNSLAFGPEKFYYTDTFTLLAMLVIGGMGSVSGAIAGALVVSVLSELLRGLERGFELGPIQVDELPGIIQLAVAVSILVILIWRPRGLLGDREVGERRSKR